MVEWYSTAWTIGFGSSTKGIAHGQAVLTEQQHRAMEVRSGRQRVDDRRPGRDCERGCNVFILVSLNNDAAPSIPKRRHFQGRGCKQESEGH